MTLDQFLRSPDAADLIVLAAFACAFGVGYAHGAIRRLLGLISMTFSFLVAAAISDPLGSFLADYWHDMPSAYSSMVAFLVIFLALVFASAIVIHGQYKRVILFAHKRFVDEVLGGVVGLMEAIAGLTFLAIILDRGFQFDAAQARSALPDLHNLWVALTMSVTGTVLHSTTIPTFLRFAWILLPGTVRGLYGK
jgi:uncharacterized membrane protein required for colicin V production